MLAPGQDSEAPVVHGLTVEQRCEPGERRPSRAIPEEGPLFGSDGRVERLLTGARAVREGREQLALGPVQAAARPGQLLEQAPERRADGGQRGRARGERLERERGARSECRPGRSRECALVIGHGRGVATERSELVRLHVRDAPPLVLADEHEPSGRTVGQPVEDLQEEQDIE